ncbi:cilia- and flagella-associated protein 97 isoform X2 [Morone saxatilis]|uniref:cilia- and flagella-associated protein 97 isoform X2 n=1 Tax=Morone saxatilis TaxID=34816 RepID=UPI0015E25149|nr:cilia- and flagella-associated protein 97 isoform X2 [Morone saxatilis]
MFNPSDLEGEVDHSFFDSDCGDSRDGGKKLEKGLKVDKQTPPAHERLHAKQTENTKGGCSLRSDGTGKHLKPVEHVSSSRAEKKDNSCPSKEDERSRVSSVACTSHKVINNSSDSEEDSKLYSKRPNGRFMALLAEARETSHKDLHSQSPTESEEESLQSSAKHSKGRSKQSPKKRIRNRCTRSPSPTSTEASIDADSESSCSSSSNRRGSSDSPVLPRSNRSSLSPGMTRIRVSASRAEESDDTVTDVSPLSSSDSSPLQSMSLNRTEAEEGSLKEQQHQEESVPSSGLSNTHQDEDSDPDVDECSLRSESQLGGKLVFCPGGRNRKNYSFTNDEVRCIDRENQRLLRELSRLSPAPRPGSTVGKKTHMASNSPFVRPSHSALNRQREQQRIERENLAFLKRLESVKPTPGLKRSQQLADYQRQVGYLGAPSYPISMSSTKKESSSSKTPSGPRPVSSAHNSSRAVSTTTNSSRTSITSNKLSAARPAWC